MRKILLILGVFVLTSASATFASASHPTWICVDSGPDSNTAVSNDDQVDYLTIKTGGSDDGHPPQTGGCVTNEGGDSGGTVFYVEVTGASDPDSSNTPETPDLKCTVPAYQNSCRVAPPTAAGGTQILRAWREVGDTNEPDMDEGAYENDAPGAYPEPDTTDVSEWTWTHGDPPPDGCGSDGECWRRISIDYRRRGGTFFGVINGEQRCQPSNIRVMKVRNNRRDRVIAVTAGNEEWRLKTYETQKGRYYAVLTRSIFSIRNTEPPEYYECPRTRSRTIEIR